MLASEAKGHAFESRIARQVNTGVLNISDPFFTSAKNLLPPLLPTKIPVINVFISNSIGAFPDHTGHDLDKNEKRILSQILKTLV